LEIENDFRNYSLKLSSTTLFSMTMQYISCQFRCQRHPFLVPPAFFSIYSAPTCGESANPQAGNEETRPFEKLLRTHNNEDASPSLH